MRRLLLLLLTIAGLSIPLLAQQPTIAKVLVAAATDTEEPQFQVLLAAALESGVLSILDDSDAEVTIFAPTDEAFFTAVADMGVSYSDLTADTCRLIALLTYHVVDGRYTVADLATENTLNTLYDNTTLNISQTGDTIYLNDTAMVITADIEAGNGIIHVVDTVLMPPQTTDTTIPDATDINTLADIVRNRDDLSTIWTVFEAAGFTSALAQDDQVMTLFLPTNDALEAAGLTAADLGITEIAYHAIEGQLLLDELANFDTLLTQQGEDISVTVTDEGVVLNNEAHILEGDIIASNGVIHILDHALIVPSSLPDVESTEEAGD